jgi:hypothetical protein
MGTIKGKKKTTLSKVVKKGKELISGKGKGGTRRHHGVAYYQNAVLKERLKKKLQRLKYGGR